MTFHNEEAKHEWFIRITPYSRVTVSKLFWFVLSSVKVLSEKKRNVSFVSVRGVWCVWYMWCGARTGCNGAQRGGELLLRQRVVQQAHEARRARAQRQAARRLAELAARARVGAGRQQRARRRLVPARRRPVQRRHLQHVPATQTKNSFPPCLCSLANCGLCTSTTYCYCRHVSLHELNFFLKLLCYFLVLNN